MRARMRACPGSRMHPQLMWDYLSKGMRGTNIISLQAFAQQRLENVTIASFWDEATNFCIMYLLINLYQLIFIFKVISKLLAKKNQLLDYHSV